MTLPPAVTVLQLDTTFPRIPGDVACPETFQGPVEILRIAGASVGRVVTADPATVPIAPFEKALDQAQGAVVVTSCGFLSYWQSRLAARTDKPFIASALLALPALCARYGPDEILTVTFDANNLNAQHFGAHRPDLIGLPRTMHLRQVISENRDHLDRARSARDLVALIAGHQRPRHKHILLECTNLSPYKSAIAAETGLPITDMLTLIEDARRGTIRPEFL